MIQVNQFHNLAHIFISLVGAILLLAIYSNIRARFSDILEEENTQNRVDKGLLYLGLSLLIWVASGIWAWSGTRFDFHDLFVYQLAQNLLSIINNALLLLALSYFYHAPNIINNNAKNVRLIIILISIVTSITLALTFMSGDLIFNGIVITAIPDLILSGFICYLLVVSLYKTFTHHNLKLVALISVLVLSLIFISQLPAVFSNLVNDYLYGLIRIIAKSSLISLFLLLATTWVITLANTPKVNEMQIHFLDWSLVKLTIPSKMVNQQVIDFGSKTTQFKNLLKLAIRRKHAKPENQSIVVNSGGEIRNQSYLSRIIDDINHELALEQDFKLVRNDLFVFIGESKYRLRILADHIVIDPSLLNEFTQQADNQEYSLFCNHL